MNVKNLSEREPIIHWKDGIISAPEGLIQGEHSTEPKHLCPPRQHPQKECYDEWTCYFVVNNYKLLTNVIPLVYNFCRDGCACDSGYARAFDETTCIPKKDCYQNKIDHENNLRRMQENV
uniref:Uncharacterized protein n=1 Tax=Romanomermis culicivorax TaxID=13658 RepID=A0A915J709_ROMCU